MGALPDLLPGYQPSHRCSRRADGARRRGASSSGHARAPHPADVRRRPRRSGQGVVRLGENIVQTDPDATQVRAAMRRANWWSARRSSCPRRPTWLTWFCRLRRSWRRTARSSTSIAASNGYDPHFPRPVKPEPTSTSSTQSPPHWARTWAVAHPPRPWPNAARSRPCSPASAHERLDQRAGCTGHAGHPSDPGEARLYQASVRHPNGRAQLAATPWLPPGEQTERRLSLCC